MKFIASTDMIIRCQYASHHVRMAADEFRRRVHYNICAQTQRLLQKRRHHRVVDAQHGT